MSTTGDGNRAAGSAKNKPKLGGNYEDTRRSTGGGGARTGEDVRAADRGSKRSDLGSVVGSMSSHLDARPSVVRQLSGGIGLLAQPRSSETASSRSITAEGGLAASKESVTTASTDLTLPSTTFSSAPPDASSTATSSPLASMRSISPPVDAEAGPKSSLLFSPSNNLEHLVPSVLLDAPSPAPHVARLSSPPPSEPQPVTNLSVLDTPNVGAASPRTPPNLRLDIPPQASAPEGVFASARDTLRAPFAPDPENEGICTEVGSLGQEIQLESGDHLNALERIYLYTQSKATFHRIFMSRALPTYLKEVTPTEAVEYVLPLLGGLAIDEEERVKETFVGELLGIIWWFFTTCRVTDQEPEQPPAQPAGEPGLDNPGTEGDLSAGTSTEPPFVSVQSFSAVLASLLLSSNPEVSATARGTVVELLGRTRWIVKQGEILNQGGQILLDEVQHTQYCETMRPVGPWSRGLLGPDEARMIQLEIIYGVIIDLGRLDLNGEVEGVEEAGREDVYQVDPAVDEGAGEGRELNDGGLYNLEVNKSREDLPTLVNEVSSSRNQSTNDEPSLSDNRSNFLLALSPPLGSTSNDPSLTPTPETVKSYANPMMYSPALDEDKDSGDDRRSGFGSLTGLASASAFSSSSSLELSSVNHSASSGTPTPRSAPAAATTFNLSSFGPSIRSARIGALPSPPISKYAPSLASAVGSTSSTSSLNLPELSPGDSSSRSSVASPAEPISPPEGAGADYITSTETGEEYRARNGDRTDQSDSSDKSTERGDLSLSGSGFSSSLSSDAGTDDLLWHTPRGGEGFDTGYFDPPSGATPTGLSNGSNSTIVSNGPSPSAMTKASPTIVSSDESVATVSNGVGLAPPYPHPGLRRQESAMSIGAISDINPDDYADAESGGDWDEGGAGSWGGAGESTDTATMDEEEKTENGAGTEGGTNEPGEVPIDMDGADGAYIDDGAAAEEAAIGRVASMSLIAAVTSSGVVDDEIYMVFVEEVMRVAADPVYWVRSETSYALGALAKAVAEETVEPYLLPILESLMTDSEPHVRQASVFALPSVLKRLDPQRRRELASNYMLKLCEDDADTVRTSALQVLAEVIHTFHEDEGGPPEELLDFFLKGENKQTQVPLTKSEAELKTPSIEKDPYSQWAADPRTTWGNEPNSYFEAEPGFPDPDRALICAFNYPAIALTLGPASWNRLAGYYNYLAQESWHTPKVRSTLAASTGEIARIVGPQAARTDIIPVWWICVSGDQREAKIKALKALPVLLEALDAEGRADVAAKLDEAWEKHVPGWKERDALAHQLSLVVPLLKNEALVLCRIFKSGLEDRVAAIREAVIAALLVLHEVLKDNNAHLKVALDDLFALGASETCRHKTTFLACCRALVESSQVTPILNDSRFGPSIVPLAEHSVIDVRIGLGRLLTAICEYHMHSWKERPAWVADCLEKLSLDASADVRSFVHRVTSTEYIEPQPIVSKQKSDSRPSSPVFAEFSRPP